MAKPEKDETGGEERCGKHHGRHHHRVNLAAEAVVLGQNYVEISRNAKGAAQITVKVHDEDPEKAYQRALGIYQEFEKAFPTGEA